MLMATCSDNISVEERLQWMHMTGEAGEGTMEVDVLRISVVKTGTAKADLGTEDAGTESTKAPVAETEDATIKSVATEGVRSD
jgi:hypothetical protein